MGHLSIVLGPVAQAILSAGGNEIERECEQAARSGKCILVLKGIKRQIWSRLLRILNVIIAFCLKCVVCFSICTLRVV